MTTKPNPIPAGYHTITPYLSVKTGAKALDFYKKAFGATAEKRMEKDGKIMHAQFKIGDSVMMLSDMFCEQEKEKQAGSSSASFYVYVQDVDAVVDQAVKAGARVKHPVATQFYGDRTGQVEDPFGFMWTIASHVEDVEPAEMKKRSEKMFAQMAAGKKS